MKKASFILVGLLFIFFNSFYSQEFGDTSKLHSIGFIKKNHLSLELFGNSMLFSVNYERVISERKSIFTLGAGYGGIILEDYFISLPSIHGHLLIPFNNKRNSFLDINTGVTLQLPSIRIKKSTNVVYFEDYYARPFIGIGYRKYFNNSIFIRANVIGVFSYGKIGPWGGISIGKCF